jgi:hypothetical protein
MYRIYSTIISFLFLLVMIDVSSLQARSKRVGQIPNGNVNQCATCHSVPNPSGGNGPRNAFGKLIESRFLDAGGDVIWNSLLASLDADNDGVLNGAELQDYFGTWKDGEPNPGSASLVSAPGSADSTPLKKLTIQFTGMTPHVGQQLEIRVIDKLNGMEVGREEVSAIPSAEFSTDLTVLLTDHSYYVDMYADFNGNSLYDAPPADHAWRIDVNDVSGATTVNFSHNTEFVDIDWKYLLTVRFKDMTPHVGQLMELRVVDSQSGKEVGRKRMEQISEADFDVDVPGIELNKNYHVDFYADLSKNYLYDPPGTDHAWRETVLTDKGDTRVDFSHNTTFTDIAWEYMFQLNFTGMSPHVGQLFEFRLFDDNTSAEIDEVNLDAVPGSDFVLMIPGIAQGEDYRADFYADHNNNKQYDAPPTDHAWRLNYSSDDGNIVQTFAHNIDFTDIAWPTAIAGAFIDAVPNKFELHQNYPNPFNPNTNIVFEVAGNELVNIEVYDILGKKIKTLVYDEFSAGSYSVSWDGRSDSGARLSSGVYVYKMSAGNYTDFRRMVMMK